MFQVLKQDWMEYERGWGRRPDGFTLHLTQADRDAFVKEHWAGMPDEAPDEYSKPEGEAEIIEVDKTIYNKIKKSAKGIWGDNSWLEKTVTTMTTKRKPTKNSKSSKKR